MKFVKLSLVAALAAGSFSALNATPLEEAIKDIDFSGVFRYRYDTFTAKDGDVETRNPAQRHNYRGQFNFKAAIADNFKAFIQLDYANNDGGFGANSVSDVSKSLNVRQAYLEYADSDYATSIIAGKYQLNNIWTDNTIDGLVGTGVQLTNTSIDGLTLKAFVVDSFGVDEQLGELFAPGGAAHNLYRENLYGAAALGSYEVGNGVLDSQLWLSYINDSLFLYALDLNYALALSEEVNWSIQGEYLGNVVDDRLEANWDNGRFFAVQGTVEGYGWDFSLGGMYYGDADKISMVVIEDQGNIIGAGEEIRNTQGSSLHGSIGRNLFGFVTAGYTFNETVRVGGDFVYGGTKVSNTPAVPALTNGAAGDKLEAVARVSYKYSPKLNFSAFYSYVDVNRNSGVDSDQNNIRLQALYKF